MFPLHPTQKQVIGKIGEDCACKYLEQRGYKVIDRNYLKKWGEIDIVTVKDKTIHFIEVKSVSREIVSQKSKKVTHVTNFKSLEGNNDQYRPEDNMHPWKLQRLGRVIQSYLLDKNVSDETEWQLDLATVYVDMSKRLSRVCILENIVL